MALNSKKKTLTPEEKQKAKEEKFQAKALKLKEEEDRRKEAKASVNEHKATLAKYLSNKLIDGDASRDTDCAFIADTRAFLQLNDGNYVLINPGDLVVIDLLSKPQPFSPCVAIYNGKMIYAIGRDTVSKDKACNQLININPEGRDDIYLSIDNCEFIGNIFYTIPNIYSLLESDKESDVDSET